MLWTVWGGGIKTPLPIKVNDEEHYRVRSNSGRTYTLCNAGGTKGYEARKEFGPSLPDLGRENSGSLTFGRGGGADVTVAADGHRVGVEGIHIRGTLGQLHRHHLGLVVGANTVVRLDVRRFQHRPLRGEKCWPQARSKTNIWSPSFFKGICVKCK